MTEFLPKWKHYGFKTLTGGEVKNIKLIKYLDWLLSQKPYTKLEYVKAHRGIRGNEAADKSAKKGMMLPWVKVRDWKIPVEFEQFEICEPQVRHSLRFCRQLSRA